MYIKFRLSFRFEFRNDLENLIEKKNVNHLHSLINLSIKLL